MGTDGEFLGRLGPELVKVLPMLDERSRRLVLGMAAGAAGEGGTAAVAALTGASWQTVANGKADLAAEEELPAGRVRRPGGGRKRLADSDPGLAETLEELIKDASRGHPQSNLRWTTRSAVHLAGELAGAGHPCSPSTVLRLLGRLGYTQQSNSRAQEGRRHPERDEQFRHIAARQEEFAASGDPVISVDSKKKEKIGNYAQHGAEWAPAGEPVQVRSHDFPDKDQPHAIPYGVYDEKQNAGFVNVGTGGNTGELAVESIRRWHQMVGKDAYPGARRLLVVCDAGGSNGYANRAWISGLADLAQQTGLDIEVCHFPPGTSKWNKIEHRLFCQISLAWRGRPLTSYDVVIDTIGAVTTKTGLAVRAVLDGNPHPTGIKISDEQMNDIEKRCLDRHHWHGKWNYALLAVPRDPGPGPVPGPGPQSASRLASREALSRPALTGTGPAALTALAAALQIPDAALREHDNCLRRLRRGGSPHSPRTRRAPRTTTADYLTALLIRRHLAVPPPVLAAVLGIHETTLSHATSRISKLLAAHAIPLPPPTSERPPPGTITTLDDLREYAAQHGITITAPPPAADTAPQATLTNPDTP
jgi:Rhodopirellula transposase DDE domain